MIKINKLNKSFLSNWKEIEIFKDLSMEINDWEFISIVWPSWSWKSTLLNMLSGIDRDYEWEININNVNLNKISDEEITIYRWKNISYIFQNFKLIENLTVQENIDLIVDMNKLERNFSTSEILEKIWLSQKKDNYVYNLSWGEAQRVAIARAFVWKTSLLLADEPTWALDVKNKDIIMKLIKKLHKETWNTIIMITHDSEVAKVSEKTYKLSNYKLIETKND